MHRRQFLTTSIALLLASPLGRAPITGLKGSHAFSALGTVDSSGRRD